jgi:hypothetical protein
MAYKWGILMYMYASDDGIDTTVNEVLSELPPAIKFDEENTEKLIGVTVCCSHKWTVPDGAETKLKEGTCRFMFDNTTARGYQINFASRIGDFLPLQNLGITKTLEDFIRWSTGLINAENYALVIWGHGGAFFEFSRLSEATKFSQQLISIEGFDNIFLRKRSGVTENRITMDALKQITDNSLFSNKYYGFYSRDIVKTSTGFVPVYTVLKARGHISDVMHTTMLTLSEIALALENTGFNSNNKIRLTMFYSCMMINLENIYELRNNVEFVLGSQDYLFFDDLKRFNFNKIIRLNYTSSALVIGENTVSAFLQLKMNSDVNWAFSCISTTKVKELAFAFKNLLQHILEKISSYRQIIKEARELCKNFADDGDINSSGDLELELVDFKWFLFLFKRNLVDFSQNLPLDDELNLHFNQSLELLLEINKTLGQSDDKIIVRSEAGTSRLGYLDRISYGANGFNILFPKDADSLATMGIPFKGIYNSKSDTLSFLNDTGWLDFLKLYFQQDPLRINAFTSDFIKVE